jgi:hypothetical protein
MDRFGRAAWRSISGLLSTHSGTPEFPQSESIVADENRKELGAVRVKALPTIEAIQSTTIIVGVLVASALLFEASPASAAGCIVGAVLMVANLSALSWTVRTMLALAQKSGGVNPLGVVAAPLKMLLLAGVVYLLIESGRLNLPGFIAGTLTQFVAIFIEVGRTSLGNKFLARSC